MSAVQVGVLLIYASLVAELAIVAVPSRVSARRILGPPSAHLPGLSGAYPHGRSLLLRIACEALPAALCLLIFLLPLAAAIAPTRLPHHPPYFTTHTSPTAIFGLLVAAFGRTVTWTAMSHLRRRGAGLGGTLITDGLFARSRHPGLLGMFLLAAGLFLIYPSLGLAFGFGLYAMHMHRKAHMEDQGLSEDHPEAYAIYAARVPRYLGRIRREAGASTQVIEAWFDGTYATRGLGYLRPIAAYRHFPTLLDLRTPHHHLDIGCGPGLLLEAATPTGARLCGLDLSLVALKMGRQRGVEAAFVHGSADALPFRDATFDRLSCIGTIERFVDRPRALREMCRVTTADARFCFMVRNARTLGWRIIKQLFGRRSRAGHEDALGQNEWTALFAAAGLRTVLVRGDPWPRARWLRALRRLFWLDPDRVALDLRPLVPLRYANEFIFVLEKAGRTANS